MVTLMMYHNAVQQAVDNPQTGNSHGHVCVVIHALVVSSSYAVAVSDMHQLALVACT
jgi:hypothetical protein